MPNTLAHMGIQALVTRGILRGTGRGGFGWSDLTWVYLGCLMPDFPWILRRAIEAMPLEVSPYDLRLYAIVQSSLFMTLALCLAFSCVSRRPGRVFAILALGSVMHLLLDALQTKWANGVHFLAPFSWELLNFGLFWPEGTPTLALTAFGGVIFITAWVRIRPAPLDLVWPRGPALGLGVLGLAFYLILPPVFFAGPLAADNHSLRALIETEARPGREAAFDRASFDGTSIATLAGERLAVEGEKLGPPGTLSLRGVFLGRDRIAVHAAHRHWPLARDLFSYVGLSLVLLAWGRAAATSWRG